MGTSPMSRTPRSRAYVRSALHSRSKRTWSASARPPAKPAHCADQYGRVATNSSISSADTGAFGCASRAGEAANAEVVR